LILYPAIDIRDGKAVRLAQGDYERETSYDDDPVEAARRWVDDGARWLHVVDLDGAREGAPVNLDHVRRIVAAVDVPIQLGGGLRDSKKVSSNLTPGDVIAVLSDRGVGRFVYTPVDVDGLMEGPDLESLQEVADATDAQVIYSGGVGSLDDLRKLSALGLENLEGVIVGRALYEGRFGVAEAQAAMGD
jgi:phosphoribosylformimino-5-aminoimidazole carboxamide ribonucleotide (ProFAR) isomerase